MDRIKGNGATNTLRTTAPKTKAAQAEQQTSAAPSMGAVDPDDRLEKKASSAAGLFSGALGAFKGVTRYLAPEITDTERASLKAMHTMLAEDKLGGADGRFNHADKAQITAALLRDRSGMRRTVKAGVADEFAKKRNAGQVFSGRLAESIAKHAVDAAYDGRKGPLAKRARARINSEAPTQIRGQLDDALRQMHVDPKSGATRDDARRTLTVGEMERFAEHGEVLDGLRERVAKQYGFEVGFPQGVTREAIEHTLEGRFGLPPGGKIIPNKK